MTDLYYLLNLLRNDLEFCLDKNNDVKKNVLKILKDIEYFCKSVNNSKLRGKIYDVRELFEEGNFIENKSKKILELQLFLNEIEDNKKYFHKLNLENLSKKDKVILDYLNYIFCLEIIFLLISLILNEIREIKVVLFKK